MGRETALFYLRKTVKIQRDPIFGTNIAPVLIDQSIDQF